MVDGGSVMQPTKTNTQLTLAKLYTTFGDDKYFIGLLRGGGPRGGVSLTFPTVPQSSQTESLGFPSYPLPLDTPGPLRTL